MPVLSFSIAQTMPLEFPFDEMLGVAPGYPKDAELCDVDVGGSYALVLSGKALKLSPTAPIKTVPLKNAGVE